MIDIPLTKTDSAYTKFMKGSNVYDLFKYNTTPVKLPISQDWLDKNKAYSQPYLKLVLCTSIFFLLQSRFGSSICLFVTTNASSSTLITQQKLMQNI